MLPAPCLGHLPWRPGQAAADFAGALDLTPLLA
jgi:hypothetical protein